MEVYFVKKRLLISLITSLISIPLVAFFFNDFLLPADFGLLGFVSIWLVPVIILYGIPVSILSDKITKKFSGSKRLSISLTVHLFLGLLFAYLFILIFDNRYVPSMRNPIDRSLFLGSFFSAFIFWVISERLRYKSKNRF